MPPVTLTAPETPIVVVGPDAEVPVPVNVAVCGLPDASSTTLNVADFAPILVGLNTTEIEQELLGDNVAPQVDVETENWVRSVPVIVLLVIVSVASPVFDNWNPKAPEDVPDCTEPKSLLAGLMDTAGAVPVPLRGAESGLVGAFDETVTVADRAPVALGVKLTVI